MITAEELEKLAELKNKGIITEDEFNAKREEFLGQSSIRKKTKKSNQKTDEDKEENNTSHSSIVGCILGIIAIIGSISYCSSDNSNNTNVSSGVCTNYNYCLRIKDEYERIASTSYCPMIKNEGTPLAQMMANEYKKVEQKYWNEINQKCPASSCNQNDFNLDPFRFCHF